MNMTSISGTTSSSILKGMSSNKLSGLASGLDTDALIEAMTTTTRSRIAKMQQQKQMTSWKMDAFRSISSKLISFQNKYTSMSSSTALRSSSFFSKNLITPSGDNSKYVKVSGSGNNADSASIVGVKQLAQNAKYVCSAGASDGKLSGTLTDVSVSVLAGEQMTVEYSGKSYTLTMSAKEYTSVQDVVEELNTQLGNITVGGDTKLSEVIQVTGEDGGNLKIDFADGLDSTLKKEVKITKIGTKMEEIFGISAEDKLTASEALTGDKTITDASASEMKTQELKDLLAGKTLTFTYNGKAASITLPAADDEQWKDANGDFDANKLEGILEKELGKAFGSGRIDVAIQEVNKDGKMVKEINFQTKLLNGGGIDTTSTLSVSGDYNALQAMSMKAGASNRLDLNAAADFNYGDAESTTITITNTATDTPYEIEIKKGATMKEIMKAINESDAGVKVSYLETSNQWSIVSTQDGASGSFKIEGALAEKIFNFSGEVSAEGKDAIAYVDYGAGKVEISRGTNTFDLNGMKVTVSGTFNEAGDTTDPTQKVTFEAKADTEKVTTAVKEMIDQYNEIIKLANDMVKEKRNRDYTPLSDEQKEDMTEEEIEKWETKAKEGILFNNGELRSFTSEIRFLFSGSGLGNSLAKMGITTSNEYSDAGKIKFDEDAFKAALEEDPEAVSKVFAGYIDEEGNTVNGLMDNVKTVFDKYAATDRATKGIFVQIAGAPESSLSMLTNTLQKQLDEYEDTIKTLQSKLEEEAERYYQKFSSLEVYINNMNTQSGWLSQQFGGY